MYEKKAKADEVDDKKGNERDTLEEFCDDFFSQMFGMPALAGKKDTNWSKVSSDIRKMTIL